MRHPTGAATKGVMNVTAVAHCIACDTVRRARGWRVSDTFPLLATPNIATARHFRFFLPAEEGKDGFAGRDRPRSPSRRSGRGRQGTRCTTRPPLGRAPPSSPPGPPPLNPPVGKGLPHPFISAPSVCCRKCERLPDELRRLPELARRMATTRNFRKFGATHHSTVHKHTKTQCASQCHRGHASAGHGAPAPAAHGRPGAKARRHTLCAHRGSGLIGARGLSWGPLFPARNRERLGFF